VGLAAAVRERHRDEQGVRCLRQRLRLVRNFVPLDEDLMRKEMVDAGKNPLRHSLILDTCLYLLATNRN